MNETADDLQVHSPYCEAPTGRSGRVRLPCAHGIIDRDASVCGASKPCPIHGGEWPDEADVPIVLRRVLLKAAAHKGIDYYWLCAIYRKGVTDASSQWRTWGIVEISVRNPNVLSYMEHWEGRAIKAESDLSALRAEVEGLRQEILAAHKRGDAKLVGYPMDLEKWASRLASLDIKEKS